MMNPKAREVRDVSGFKPIRIPWMFIFLLIYAAVLSYLVKEAFDDQKEGPPGDRAGEIKNVLCKTEATAHDTQVCAWGGRRLGCENRLFYPGV